MFGQCDKLEIIVIRAMVNVWPMTLASVTCVHLRQLILVGTFWLFVFFLLFCAYTVLILILCIYFVHNTYQTYVYHFVPCVNLLCSQTSLFTNCCVFFPVCEVAVWSILMWECVCMPCADMTTRCVLLKRRMINASLAARWRCPFTKDLVRASVAIAECSVELWSWVYWCPILWAATAKTL